MFGVGSGELLLLLVIAFLLFGPERLPEFAKTLGRWVHEFRSASDQVKDAVIREAKDTFETRERALGPGGSESRKNDESRS